MDSYTYRTDNSFDVVYHNGGKHQIIAGQQKDFTWRQNPEIRWETGKRSIQWVQNICNWNLHGSLYMPYTTIDKISKQSKKLISQYYLAELLKYLWKLTLEGNKLHCICLNAFLANSRSLYQHLVSVKRQKWAPENSAIHLSVPSLAAKFWERKLRL